jgi:hypothetical protein
MIKYIVRYQQDGIPRAIIVMAHTEHLALGMLDYSVIVDSIEEY